jgi:hypothetical protein
VIGGCASNSAVSFFVFANENKFLDDVLSHSLLNIAFRRTLSCTRWKLWLQLVEKLMHVQLNNDQNMFVCGFTTSGGFTVKSMYLDLLNYNTKYLRKYIWKMKVPLKIEVFMWFLHRKVILTKDMVKKIGMGIQHVVFVIRMKQYNIFF